MSNVPLKLSNRVSKAIQAKSQSYHPEIMNKLKELQNGEGYYSEFCGWYDYPSKVAIQASEDWQSQIESIGVDYDSLVLIGVGGSFLGAKALYELFAEQTNKEMFFAGWHLSGLELSRLFSKIQNKKPLLVFISKSGTTIEPALHFRNLYEWMRFKFKDEAPKRVIAVTDKEKGALRGFCNRLGIQSYVVPDDIGGRYSVFSPVGMIPLLCSGAPIEPLLSGADLFYEQLRSGLNTNLLKEYVGIRRALWDQGRKTECMLYNEPAFEFFAGWWQQLFGESEGKDHKGILPISSSITRDLHSMGQFFQQGTPVYFETFVTFKNSLDNLPFIEKCSDFEDGYDGLIGKKIDYINHLATEATMKAHHENGDVPIMHFELDSLSLESAGYFMSFFKVAAALSAGLFEVNPFDQPGVEFYKAHMKDKL